MINLFKNLFITTGLIISSICFGGTIDPNTPDDKHIKYAADFKYVYKICGTYNDGQLFCASAVAIAPNWILTAAHVVENQRTCLIHKDDKAYMIKEIIIHKDFEKNKFGFADIAIGYISEDLELDFYPPLYEDNDEIGKICSISGYGLTGTFNTGAIKSDQKQRAGSNYIDAIDRDLLICSITNNNKTSLEFLIASGDSGGGLFIGNKLAGINSCVLAKDKNPNSNYGDESGHTRISNFVPWIKEIMKKKRVDKVF